MRRLIIALWMTLFTLHATEFTLEFTPEEWQQIGDPAEFVDDLVVLTDGTKIWGKVKQVPTIHYSWGKVDFSVTEVAGITFHPGEARMQVVTRNGQNFIGKFPIQPLQFEQRHTIVSKEPPKKKLWFFKEKQENVEYMERKIETKFVNFVLLKRRGSNVPLLHERFHSVELLSGDRFPVLLGNGDIHLSDGWRDFEVKSRDIVDVKFKGGLHGRLKGEGLDREVDFSFVKDKYLPVRLAKNGQRLKIPWSQVARIRGDMGEFILTTPYHFSQRVPEGMAYVPPGRFLLSPQDPMVQSVRVEERQGLNRALGRRIGAGTAVATGRIPLIDPTYVVEMEGFYIDKYEVTNMEYAQFVRATGHRAPPHWPKGRVPRDIADHPVVNVNYQDAQAYAAWAGKRLPTELEWERAARGGDEQLDEGFVRYQAHVEETTTRAVGASAARTSSLSVFDMAGNVAEWTTSPFERNETKKLQRLVRPPISKIYKAVRGGAYTHSRHTGTPLHRAPLHEKEFNAWTGFRCVSDVAPEYR